MKQKTECTCFVESPLHERTCAPGTLNNERDPSVAVATYDLQHYHASTEPGSTEWCEATHLPLKRIRMSYLNQGVEGYAQSNISKHRGYNGAAG